VRIGASDRTSWTLWAARDLQIGFGHVVVVNAVPVLYIVKKWLTDWVWTCSGRKRGPGVVYRKEVVGGGIYRFGLDM
jgi:hypothetical protein